MLANIHEYLADNKMSIHGYLADKNMKGELGGASIESAILIATKSIEWNPTADAHFFRSGLYRRARKIQESIADLKEVNRLNPDFVLEFMFRANDFHHVHKLADVKVEEFRAALAAFDETIKEQPKDWMLYQLRSRLHTFIYERTGEKTHFLQAAKDTTMELYLRLQEMRQ